MINSTAPSAPSPDNSYHFCSVLPCKGMRSMLTEPMASLLEMVSASSHLTSSTQVPPQSSGFNGMLYCSFQIGSKVVFWALVLPVHEASAAVDSAKVSFGSLLPPALKRLRSRIASFLPRNAATRNSLTGPSDMFSRSNGSQSRDALYRHRIISSTSPWTSPLHFFFVSGSSGCSEYHFLVIVFGLSCDRSMPSVLPIKSAAEISSTSSTRQCSVSPPFPVSGTHQVSRHRGLRVFLSVSVVCESFTDDPPTTFRMARGSDVPPLLKIFESLMTRFRPCDTTTQSSLGVLARDASSTSSKGSKASAGSWYHCRINSTSPSSSAYHFFETA
mmetsp:Transcript_6878/g.19324  ORF Transcript_6878/g.19324 Transcript_6878/m.19324 type:complete len:330 (-) Transcript_6878:8545-9534(-)